MKYNEEIRGSFMKRFPFSKKFIEVARNVIYVDEFGSSYIIKSRDDWDTTQFYFINKEFSILNKCNRIEYAKWDFKELMDISEEYYNSNLIVFEDYLNKN